MSCISQFDPAASGAAVAAGVAAVGEDGEGAGLLVAQILETKKEMEDGRRNAFSPETPGHRRVPIVSFNRALECIQDNPMDE